MEMEKWLHVQFSDRDHFTMTHSGSITQYDALEIIATLARAANLGPEDIAMALWVNGLIPHEEYSRIKEYSQGVKSKG